MKHVTSIDRLEMIQENGLTLTYLQANTKRESQSGEELYDGEGVWLWGEAADDEAIRDFATSNYQEYVVITFDVTGIEMISDAEYPEGVAYIALEEIPADRITGIEIVDY